MKEKIIKEDEDIIQEELECFYQTYVLECHEQDQMFIANDFSEKFCELMKMNFRKIYDNYCINCYVSSFLKEKEKQLWWGEE